MQSVSYRWECGLEAGQALVAFFHIPFKSSLLLYESAKKKSAVIKSFILAKDSVSPATTVAFMAINQNLAI